MTLFIEISALAISKYAGFPLKPYTHVFDLFCPVNFYSFSKFCCSLKKLKHYNYFILCSENVYVCDGRLEE